MLGDSAAGETGYRSRRCRTAGFAYTSSLPVDLRAGIVELRRSRWAGGHVRDVDHGTSWWTRPSLRDEPLAYRNLVLMSDRRDLAAAKRRAEPNQREISPESRNFFAEFAPLSVYSEDIGGFAAEALLAVGLPPDLRARLVRAMWDEVRHSDLFLNLCEQVDVDVSGVDTAPVESLLSLLDTPTGPLDFAVLHAELEALALDLFQLIVAADPNTRIGDTFRTVAADEATHVALGFDVVEHLHDKGEQLDEEELVRVLDSALALSPLGNPDSLAPLSGQLGLPVGALVARLASRRDWRGARFRALLSAH
jgi:hypothetical protein